MRDSTNTDPIFVSVLPDWGKEVTIEGAHDTTTIVARAGIEQRQRNRFAARYRISFTRRGENREAWKARWVRLQAEMQSVCMVPFWTEGADAVRTLDRTDLISSTGVHVLARAGVRLCVAHNGYRMPFPLRSEMWKVGGYAFVFNGTEGRFQEILEVSSDPPRTMRGPVPFRRIKASPTAVLALRQRRAYIRLASPSNDDLGAMNTARIFPCLRCRRVPQSEDQQGSSLDSIDETVVFEAL